MYHNCLRCWEWLAARTPNLSGVISITARLTAELYLPLRLHAQRYRHRSSDDRTKNVHTACCTPTANIYKTSNKCPRDRPLVYPAIIITVLYYLWPRTVRWAASETWCSHMIAMPWRNRQFIYDNHVIKYAFFQDISYYVDTSCIYFVHVRLIQ